VTLAAALEPVVGWLEGRMPRLLAIILTYLVLLLLLGALIWAVIPSLVAQVQDLGSAFPNLIERARSFIERWSGSLPGDSFRNTILSQLSSLGPTLLRLPLTATSAISGLLMVLFISFYLLRESSRMQDFLLSLFPDDRRGSIHEVMTAMGQAMGGYFRGVIINGVIVGIITFIGLLIIGIDCALVYGALAGILELIPIAGPIVATIIIVGLTLLESPGQALAALIFMVILQQVENNILVPLIMRSQTEVSSLLTILAIFAGGAIGGLLGALIAIPVAAALRVLVRQVLAPAIRRQTGVDPPEGSPA
jgi:predicted PurR-regulated permease PerM